jgi:hypothetical protein
MHLRGFICLFLSVHGALPLYGQAPAGPARPLEGPALKILVLEGEGGRNTVKPRVGVPILIEVQDSQGRPLPGASVIFQLPAAGPSGSFPGGVLTQRMVANARGQAATSGFVPSSQEGRLNVRVTASSGGLGVTQIVGQTNVLPTAGKAGGSKRAVWILVAAGVGGAVLGGMKRGGTSPAAPVPNPSSVLLVPGPVTVGGPR